MCVTLNEIQMFKITSYEKHMSRCVKTQYRFKHDDNQTPHVGYSTNAHTQD